MPRQHKSGWPHVAFGDVVRLIRERSADPIADGFVRYVGLEHLDPGDLIIRRWGTIANGTTFTNIFRSGQVLFGKRRAYQRKVALAEFEGVCSGDIYVLEPKDNHLVPELLSFICQSDAFFEHAVGTSAGSLSPRTNWESLASYEFPLPPQEEQRRIGRVLGSLLALRASLQELLDRARYVHRSYLEALRATQRTQLTPLRTLISDIEAGSSLLGASTPPLGGEYGVLKVSAVDSSGFRPGEAKRILKQEEFLPNLSVRAKDLLMTRANTPDLVGEVCLVERDHPNLMLSDKTLRLHPASEADRYLLWEGLQSADVRRQITMLATGTGRAMKNISQEKIYTIRVPYPSDADTAVQLKSELIALREGIRRIGMRLDQVGAMSASMREALLST